MEKRVVAAVADPVSPTVVDIVSPHPLSVVPLVALEVEHALRVTGRNRTMETRGREHGRRRPAGPLVRDQVGRAAVGA